MKKLLLIFVLCFSFINVGFANTGEVENLHNKIKTLEVDYKNLNDKYNSFLSGGIESYAKILVEGKLQTEEKAKAYDIALNQIKYWFWIIAAIFGLIGVFAGIFGYKKWSDIRDGIIKNIQENIALDTSSIIELNSSKLNKDLQKDIDLKISKFNEDLSYSKMKELKDVLLSDSEVYIKSQTEKLFNETIDKKLEQKVKELLLPDNQN